MHNEVLDDLTVVKRSGQRVPFNASKIAIAIAQNLPPGISLDTLNLDAQNFSQPLNLQLHGDSYDDAIRYKKLLEGSPLFQDVHLQSVTASAEGGVTIAISTVMNPEAIQ